MATATKPRTGRKHLIAANRMIRNAKALGVWSSLELEGVALQDMVRTADIRSLSARELETYRSLILRFRRVMDGPSQPAEQVSAQELLHELLFHDAKTTRCATEGPANSYLFCPAFG